MRQREIINKTAQADPEAQALELIQAALAIAEVDYDVLDDEKGMPEGTLMEVDGRLNEVRKNIRSAARALGIELARISTAQPAAAFEYVNGPTEAAMDNYYSLLFSLRHAKKRLKTGKQHKDGRNIRNLLSEADGYLTGARRNLRAWDKGGRRRRNQYQR